MNGEVNDPILVLKDMFEKQKTLVASYVRAITSHHDAKRCHVLKRRAAGEAHRKAISRGSTAKSRKYDVKGLRIRQM